MVCKNKAKSYIERKYEEIQGQPEELIVEEKNDIFYDCLFNNCVSITIEAKI